MNELLDLIRYTDWANARLVGALRELSDEALSAPIASSFGSVRETFAHIVSAEWVWLRRWRGESPTAVPAWVDGGTRATLLAQLSAVQKERTQFLAELSQHEFEGFIDYRTLNGEAHRQRLADLIRHVVNHSTYHRGQAATQLRQLGRVPPSTDFIVYRREIG